MAKRSGSRLSALSDLNSDFMVKARARFKLADTSDKSQRDREREDLAFYAGDQWPADIMLARKGQQPINGLPSVPARPTMVINTLREPVRQILNEERAADLGISLVPADDLGDLGVVPDPKEVELREGLVRRIQRESSAADARTWAYGRAVIAGRGYYAVLTRYLKGKTFDQEVYVYRIFNQAGVVLDPSHQEPDGSDCEWQFMGTDMLWEEYCATYPQIDGEDNPLIHYGNNDTNWRALGDEYPDWFVAQTDARTSRDKNNNLIEHPEIPKSVRVESYWYAEYTTRVLCILSDSRLVWKDEIPTKQVKEKGKKAKTVDDLPEGVTIADEREVTERTIRCAKIDGCQVIEDLECAGPDMPIIKVLGEELQPYDHDRRVEGMVRPARSSSQGTNYMVSKLVETVGWTPLTPLIADPDAVDGYPEWDVLSSRVVSYARARSYDDQGRPLKEPHRPQADPNLAPMSQAIAMFSGFTEKTTAVPAARLGDIDPVTRSGKALSVLTQNSQQSTSNYLDNLVRSMKCEAKVINNLLFPIYGQRPGRLVKIMNGEGHPQTAFINDPRNPQFAQQHQLARQAKLISVLTKDANFNVAAKIGRQYDTRRQEEDSIIGQLIAANPQLITWFGDIFFKNQDGPGHEEMAARAKVMLAPQIQQYLASQEQGTAPPTPREMALQAQNKQLTGAVQQLMQDRQGKVIEGQFRTHQTEIQESAETQRQREKNETTITVAELNALAKEMQDTRAFFLEERGRIGAQIHEAVQSALDRQHDAEQAQADRQQQSQQMAMDAAGQTQQLAAQAVQPPSNGQGAQ
jgi:hypothetical protein